MQIPETLRRQLETHRNWDGEGGGPPTYAEKVYTCENSIYRIVSGVLLSVLR